jgi:hypothetical protein
MLIKTNFTSNGVPQEGLAPTIRIINLPGQQVEVSGAGMTENIELTGSYYYDFATYSITGNYDIRCDGGMALSNYDRYTWGTNSDDLEVGTGVTKIINDLDNPSQYMANVTGINDLSGYIAPIAVDLDNPSQYMANVTELANISGYIQPVAVEVTQASGAIVVPANYMANVSGINDLSGYIAPIQVQTTAIKAKTDYLPADLSGEIAIVQGLLHSNIYTVPGWTDDDMTTALIKLYDNKANAITHGAGGLLATFSMTGMYSAGKAQSILMVRES